MLDEIEAERTNHHDETTVSVKAKSLSPYRPTADGTVGENEGKSTPTKAGDRKPTPKHADEKGRKSNIRTGAITPRGRISRTPKNAREERKEKSPISKSSTKTVSREEYNRLKDYVDELDYKTNVYQTENKDLQKKCDKLQTQNELYRVETEGLTKQVQNLTNLYDTLSNDRSNQMIDKRVNPNDLTNRIDNIAILIVRSSLKSNYIKIESLLWNSKSRYTRIKKIQIHFLITATRTIFTPQ